MGTIALFILANAHPWITNCSQLGIAAKQRLLVASPPVSLPVPDLYLSGDTAVQPDMTCTQSYTCQWMLWQDLAGLHLFLLLQVPEDVVAQFSLTLPQIQLTCRLMAFVALPSLICPQF